MENELIRLDNGYFVEDDSYVTHSDDMIDHEDNNSDSNSAGRISAPLREQDRFLPIANIAKIMKRAIPYNGKVAKDARECVQECLSEFISFVTSEASDRCQIEKRKTISGEDVLFALSTLGFDDYVEPLRLYLKKYREMVLNPVSTVKVLDASGRSKSVITYEIEDGVQDNSDGEELQTELVFPFPSHKGNFDGI